MKKLMVAVMLFAAAFAHAETKTYVGANGGSWSGVNQWDPVGNPGADDDVIIEGKFVHARGEKLNVKSITITGEGGALETGAPSSSLPAPDTYVAVSGDLIVTNGASLYVYACRLPDLDVFADQATAMAAIYANPTVVSVGGTFAVEADSKVYTESEWLSGAAVFFKVGDFNLAAGGEVSSVDRGWNLHEQGSNLETLPVGKKARWYYSWYTTYAFGTGVDYGWGAGYGGAPLMTKTISEPDKTSIASHPTSPDVPWTSVWTSGQTYGSAYAPFLSGSPSGQWGSGHSRGSGSICIFATGDAVVAGTLNANGGHSCSYISIPGTSGGGIWLCGKTVELTETSQLLAKGGKTTGYSYSTGCGGGGGRISIGVGLTQANIDTLAALAMGVEPAEADFFTETLTSPGLVSVIGGPDQDDRYYGNPGTATRVYSMAGRARMTVAGEPVEAISAGVTYGVGLIDCSETVVYTSDVYGRDPTDPKGLVRPCLGWVVYGKTKKVAESTEETKCRAELSGLDPEEGPFTITWQWGDASSGRAIDIDRAGGGTVTARGVTHTDSFSLPAGAADEMTATANAGYRFLGWTGLPSGFSANATVTMPSEAGLLVTALFEPIDGVYQTKTWLGGTDQKWETAANWNPAGVPTLKDDVVIYSGNCQIGFSAIAHSITLASGKVLQVFSSSTEVEKSEGTGKIGKAIVADNTDTRKHRHLFVAGDVTAEGTVVIGGSGAVFTNMELHVGGDFTLNGSAKMAIYPTALDLSVASTPTNLYRAANFFTVGGNFTMNGTSVLYPWCEQYTGTSMRFDIGTNLTVAAGATVNAQGLGWFWRSYTAETADPLRTYTFKYTDGSDKNTTYETRSIGGTDTFSVGAGHGTWGNSSTKGARHKTMGHEYGYASAPFLPGSASGSYNNVYPLHAGGGAVWFKCGRKLTVNGTIKANAESYDNQYSFYGGAAGGSVWLLGRGLGAGADASVSARGGRSNYGYSAGAGGRVAIVLGVSDEDIEALAMGETPEGLEYADTTDLIPIDVRGGEDGTYGGATICTQTGTVSFVKGPNADKTLTVSAAVLAGTPSPAYGNTPVMIGEELTITATTDPDGYGVDPEDPDSTRWTCAGYVVSNATEQLASGSASSFSFTMPSEQVFVTWFWKDKESGVSFTNPQGTTYGSLLFNGAAYEPGTKMWLTAGVDYTVEAVPADGYEFLYWSGDFPYGKARTNPLTLAAKSGVTMRPVFRRTEAATTRTWLGSSSTPGDFLTESNWSGGNFPGPDDDVIVAQGSCQVQNNYVEINSLVVSNDYVRFLVGMTVRLNGGAWNPKFGDAEQRYEIGAAYFPTTVSALADEVGLVVKGDVVVEEGAQLGVGAPNAFRAAHGRLEAANITVNDASELLVTAGAVDDTFTFARGAGFVKVAGTFAVNDTAKFRPVSDGWTGGSVKTTAGTFTLAEDAWVRAKGQGFIRKRLGDMKHDDPRDVSLGIGQGYSYSCGAGYGGIGGGDRPQASYGASYGWKCAPIHPGSPNGNYNYPFMAGGGLVRIHAKTMAVNGTIDASALEEKWTSMCFYGGASGGGIWLTAANLSFGANVTNDVHGGYTTYNNPRSCGAGGRIAICQTDDAEVLEALATTGKVRGYPALSLARFTSAFPGVTVNVAGGDVYTDLQESRTSHDFIRHCNAENNGTFAYVVSQGLVLIVK